MIWCIISSEDNTNASATILIGLGRDLLPVVHFNKEAEKSLP